MKHPLLAMAFLCLFAGHAGANGEPRVEKVLEGKASYYYGKWIGRKTANGEIYRRGDMTAAHKSLPFGTNVRVLNLRNGRDVVGADYRPQLGGGREARNDQGGGCPRQSRSFGQLDK
jgi:hypothetical protein